jgi:hypothetical protein
MKKRGSAKKIRPWTTSKRHNQTLKEDEEVEEIKAVHLKVRRGKGKRSRRRISERATDDAPDPWHSYRRRHRSAAVNSPRDPSERHESAPSVRSVFRRRRDPHRIRARVEKFKTKARAKHERKTLGFMKREVAIKKRPTIFKTKTIDGIRP